jgi:hypothetical protein
VWQWCVRSVTELLRHDEQDLVLVVDRLVQEADQLGPRANRAEGGGCSNVQRKGQSAETQQTWEQRVRATNSPKSAHRIQAHTAVLVLELIDEDGNRIEAIVRFSTTAQPKQVSSRGGSRRHAKCTLTCCPC